MDQRTRLANRLFVAFVILAVLPAHALAGDLINVALAANGATAVASAENADPNFGVEKSIDGMILHPGWAGPYCGGCDTQSIVVSFSGNYVIEQIVLYGRLRPIATYGIEKYSLEYFDGT
jgi:hypothetical protein